MSLKSRKIGLIGYKQHFKSSKRPMQVILENQLRVIKLDAFVVLNES